MRAEAFLERFDTQATWSRPNLQKEDPLFVVLNGAYSPEHALSADFELTAEGLYKSALQRAQDPRLGDWLSAGMINLSARTVGQSANRRTHPGLESAQIVAHAEQYDYDQAVDQLYTASQFLSIAAVSQLLHHGSADIFLPGEEKTKNAAHVVGALGQFSTTAALMMAAHVTTVSYRGTEAGRNFAMHGIDTETMIVSHHFEVLPERPISEAQEAELKFQEKVASTLLEVDAFLALNEWVRLHRLPYIPVIAPIAIEKGARKRMEDDRNPHADILLLGVGNSDIIPIQVKLRHKDYHKDEYIPEMVFLNSDEVAIQESAQVLLRDGEGPVRTGREVTSILGDITCSWVKYHRAPKGVKPRHKKTMQKKTNYAFRSFDVHIGKELAA